MFPEKEDPTLLLLESMMTGNPSDAIVNQEKRGQQVLARSQVLPIQMQSCTREQFEKLGIVFGEDADDIFVYVTLPEGWRIQPTDHDMWSYLLDDKGRERAGIFYKAAFYDRSAHIFLCHRYSYTTQPTCGYDNPDYAQFGWVGVVKDCKTIIWQTDPIPPDPTYQERDTLRISALEWIGQHYPDWDNPMAYWEDNNG